MFDKESFKNTTAATMALDRAFELLDFTDLAHFDYAKHLNLDTLRSCSDRVLNAIKSTPDRYSLSDDAYRMYLYSLTIMCETLFDPISLMDDNTGIAAAIYILDALKKSESYNDAIDMLHDVQPSYIISTLGDHVIDSVHSVKLIDKLYTLIEEEIYHPLMLMEKIPATGVFLHAPRLRKLISLIDEEYIERSFTRFTKKCEEYFSLLDKKITPVLADFDNTATQFLKTLRANSNTRLAPAGYNTVRDVEAVLSKYDRFLQKALQWVTHSWARAYYWGSDFYGRNKTDYIKFLHFSVDDPYETFFGYIYSLLQNEDLAWTPIITSQVSYAAACLLPWTYDLPNDDKPERTQFPEQEDIYFERDSSKDIYARTPVEFALFTDPYQIERTPHAICNASQLFFDQTDVIPIRPALVSQKSGIDLTSDPDVLNTIISSTLSLVNGICFALQNAFGELYEPYPFSDLVIGEDEEDVMPPHDDEESMTSLPYETTKQDEDKLKRYQAKITDLEEIIRTLQREKKEMKQEIRHLREEIFSSSDTLVSVMDEDSEEIELPADVSLPVTLSKKYAILGGHDSFMREFKDLIEGRINYISRNEKPRAEQIASCDCLFIQNNATSHSAFYKAVGIAKKNNIPIEYFQFASARKCALQLHEYDQR